MRHSSIRTLALVAAVAGASCAAVAQSPTEYELKAAVLYNLAKFVTWPKAISANHTFTLCVVGKDPFGSVLEQTFRSRTIHGRSITILRRATVADVEECDMVFLPAGEHAQLDALLAMQNRGILTVSDRRGFAKAGGMVELVRLRSRIRFEVNTWSAKDAGLQMKSSLLRLAKITNARLKRVAEPPPSPVRD